MTSIKSFVIYLCSERHPFSVVISIYVPYFLFVEVAIFDKVTLCSSTVECGRCRVWIVKREGGGKAVLSLKWHHGWIYL